MIAERHIGLSPGRIEHWHDGLGEFSRQLGLALAARAAELKVELGWRLWFHLPRRWHGVFGDAVGYLATHTTQRIVHFRQPRFALWHRLHQHNRLRAPLGTRRCVETVHDLNFLHSKSPRKVASYRARLRRRLQACDSVIAITQHVADDLGRELPGLATPLRVIHNGATDLTRAAQQPVAGVDPHAPYLLHVSRMAPNKNIAALLELAAAWPERQLVLAGATSPYIDVVQREVAQRRLANVTIRVDISEAQKAWLYAHCSAFVFPSLAEGFGLPPIEAMHFGKPVFLSRLTALPEVGGEAAHYFDAFEGASMRAVVEAGIAADAAPGRSEAIVAHARGFNWTRCADQHVALYRELLGAAA